jgi:hypothetical protein
VEGVLIPLPSQSQLITQFKSSAKSHRAGVLTAVRLFVNTATSKLAIRVLKSNSEVTRAKVTSFTRQISFTIGNTQAPTDTYVDKHIHIFLHTHRLSHTGARTNTHIETHIVTRHSQEADTSNRSRSASECLLIKTPTVRRSSRLVEEIVGVAGVKRFRRRKVNTIDKRRPSTATVLQRRRYTKSSVRRRRRRFTNIIGKQFPPIAVSPR